MIDTDEMETDIIACTFWGNSGGMVHYTLMYLHTIDFPFETKLMENKWF